MVKVEAIPSTLHDYNPDMDCQFFHTRQVGTCLRHWMLVQFQDAWGIKPVTAFIRACHPCLRPVSCCTEASVLR